MRTVYAYKETLMRAGPSTNTVVVAKIPEGTQLVDLEPTPAPPEGWLNVRHTPAGTTTPTDGYVKAGEIGLVPPPPKPTPPKPNSMSKKPKTPRKKSFRAKVKAFMDRWW